MANSNGALQLCYFKTHDFYTADPEGTDQSYSIGSDVDSLRAAVAKDNFNKARKYYGERYVDFLAAMGVRTGWQIHDEPELVKKSSQTLLQSVTKTTNDDSAVSAYVGELKGNFATKHKHALRRKFFPEHGLVMTLAAWKVEKLIADSQPPWNNHITQQDYWSPEYDAEREHAYEGRLWNNAYSIGTQITLPNFEHLPIVTGKQ